LAEQEQKEEAKGVMRLALELLRSDEKSAADREAKLAVLRFLATLEKGHTEDYIKGYTTGYTEGFRDGYALHVAELEGERSGVE